MAFTTSVIYLLPPDHPVFSASSSSLFRPFLGDERPNICPSNKPSSWPSRHALRPQAVSARVDLRCPSVYTLCWMRPYRPPSVHIGSMWSKNGEYYATSIYQRIDQLTISTSSSVFINDLSSSTLFLLFLHLSATTTVLYSSGYLVRSNLSD